MTKVVKPSKQHSRHPFGFGPKVKPENIPQHMKDNCLWCVWEGIEKERPDGSLKMDKIPYNNQGRVSTQRPKLWMGYEDAYALYNESIKDNGDYVFNGVGILFPPNGDIVGIDIDNDLELGIWGDINTYKEYSPSGNGLRVIGTGWTDFDLTKPVEIYSGNAPRFVTITGDIIGDCLDLMDIGDIANEIVLDNKANIAPDAGDNTGAGLCDIPSNIEFDNQEWWPKHNLRFPADCKDRSATLYGWSKTLISEGLTDQQVFSVYVANPEILGMAEDHWKGAKAKKYLWRDITKARAEAKAEYESDVGEFGDIEGIVDFDSVASGDTEITGDIEIDKMLVAREQQSDKYTLVEKDVLQPWNKDTVPILPSLGKLKFAYRNAVYNGKNSKFHVMDKHGFIKVYGDADYLRCEVKMRHILGKLDGGTEADALEYIKIAGENFKKGIKANRQFVSYNRKVDMFIKKPMFLRHNNGVVDHIVSHKPFPYNEKINSDHEIVEDYLWHFPQYHVFLDSIVDARFASNRRQCSTWMQADSNWGKGFLTSMFEHLGIVMSITEVELEKAFSGAPLGKNMSLAHHVWIIHIDEFKKVKAELKLLDNSLTGASKNELETKVEVYTKLFTSAETVDALAGEDGVEAQFANRFNYFKDLTGNIEDMEVWSKYGQDTVFKVMLDYTARELNKRVARYVKMGRAKATKQADTAIADFHKVYTIVNAFKRLEDSYDGYAEAFTKLVNNLYGGGGSDLLSMARGPKAALYSDIIEHTELVEQPKVHKKYLLVKKGVPLMNNFLYLQAGKSEGAKIAHKAKIIADKCGYGRKKIGGEKLTGIFIEVDLEEQNITDFED